MSAILIHRAHFKRAVYNLCANTRSARACMCAIRRRLANDTCAREFCINRVCALLLLLLLDIAGRVN